MKNNRPIKNKDSTKRLRHLSTYTKIGVQILITLALSSRLPTVAISLLVGQVLMELVDMMPG